MTDRDRYAPPWASNPGPPATPAGGSPPDAHQDSPPPMPVTTLAPPAPGRLTTDHPPSPTPPPDRGRAWLNRLLAGDLASPGVVPVCVPHAGRGPAEHDAVARALGCPDLFVIAGDGPARERVVAEVARAAGRTGRVLVLSPDPAAADRLTAAIADHGPSVVRALAADENPIRPTPAVTRSTSADRAERVRRDVAAGVAGAEARLARLVTAAERVEQTRDLAARLADVEARQAELRARLAVVETDVRDEADGKAAPTALAAALDRLRAEQQTATAPVGEKLAAATADRAEKAGALAAVQRQIAEHAADAGRKPGLLARLFGGKPKPHAAEPADLEHRRDELERGLKEITDRVAELQAELDAATTRFTAERVRLIADEVAARRTEIESRLAPLDAEADHFRKTIDENRATIAAAGLDAEAAGLATQRAAAEEQLADARARHDDFARGGPAAVARLLAEVPVVVGTPGSLDADPAFDGLPADAPPFALVVLDRAEELTEPDFVNLARLGDRWVLAGELPEEPRPALNGTPGRGPRHGQPPESFLARLVRRLDRESLAAEADRLVCRLAHPTPEQRRAMTREPLADRPEVELRFVPGEAGSPVLAEIAFPAGTTAADAKAFVARELGEVLLRPCGEPERRYEPDRIAVCWPCPAAAGPSAWIDLEPGVREQVTGPGPHAFTAAVAFDTATWDADRAEAWLAARLPAASPGRVAVLPKSNVPHTARPVAVG